MPSARDRLQQLEGGLTGQSVSARERLAQLESGSSDVGAWDYVKAAAGGLAGLGRSIDEPLGRILEQIPREPTPAPYREGDPLTMQEAQYGALPWYAKPGTHLGGFGAQLGRDVLGFVTQTPHRILSPPEGQTSTEAVWEEAKGFGRMLGHLPAQAQYVMFPGVSPETHAKSPFVHAPAAIAGEAPEEFQKEAVRSMYETRGTEPLFSASILAAPAGAIKGRAGRFKLGKGKGKGNLLRDIEIAEKAEAIRKYHEQKSKQITTKSARESASVLVPEAFQLRKPVTKSALESAKILKQPKAVPREVVANIFRSAAERALGEKKFARFTEKERAMVEERLSKVEPRKSAVESAALMEEIFATRRSPKGKKYIELLQGIKPETLEKAKWVGITGTGAVATALAFMDDDQDIKKALGLGLIAAVTNRTGRGIVRRVKADGNPFTRPIKRLGESAIGKEAKQSTVKMFTEQRLGKAKHITRFMDTIYEQYGGRDIRGTAKLWKSIPGRILFRRDSKWMKENFKSLIEKPNEVKPPNPRVAKLAEAWKAVSNEIATELENIGHKVREVRFEKKSDGTIVRREKKVPFRRQTNYFPDILTEQARVALETQKGTLFDAIKREARVRGIDVDFLINDMNPYAAKRFGSVDYARIANLPDRVKVNGKWVKLLETDPFKIIPRHIENAHRRIAVIREFGENASAKASQIGTDLLRKEGSLAAEAWKDLWAHMNGLPVDKFNKGHWMFKVGDVPLQLARFAQLSTAAVMQAGSYYIIAARTSPKAFINSLFNSLRSPAKFDRLAESRRLGGWSYDVMADLYAVEDLHGLVGEGVRRGFKVTLMNATNRHINKVAALSGMHDLARSMEVIRNKKSGVIRDLWGVSEKQYRRQLKRNYNFTDADIARMVEKGPSQLDLARVVQMMPEATNLFRESGMVRPRWLSKYASRQFFAYTGPMRAFGNVLSDALAQAKEGNVRPLTTFLVGGVVTGETLFGVKNWLFDRAREEISFWVRLYHDLLYAGALGLVGEAAQRVEFSLQYDENPFDVSPPPLRAGEELAKTVSDLVGDKDITVGERVQQTAERSMPLYRALWRNYGRFARGDEYVVDRVRRSVYLQSGKSAKGERYKRGDPKPEMFPRTTQMLLERAEKKRKPGAETIVQRIKRENREIRREQRAEARR